MRVRFLILYTLIIVTGLFLHLRSVNEVPLAHPLAAFPASINDWRVTGQTQLSESILKVLRPTDYLSRRYVSNSGEVVDLYIGYFDGGLDSGGVHSPRHCLPGSGWSLEFHEEKVLTFDGNTIRLVNAVYRKGEVRQFFTYWFQVSGMTINNEYYLKAAEVFNSMVKNRRDSAFVRISTDVSNGDMVQADSVSKFVQDFYPVINSFLSS